MSGCVCVDCGTPERRGTNEKGRPTLNLDPTTGRCTNCTVKASAAAHTFHSRRDHRKGQVIDTKARPFDGRAAAARNDE